MTLAMTETYNEHMNTQFNKTSMIRYLFLTICLLLPQTSLLAADINVRLSHNPVALSDSFQLVFNAIGSLDGEPDFSPLEQNFEILGRSQNQNIQMINGNVTRQTNWTLMLMAKDKGAFQIPAIRFGSDLSKPISINVIAAATPQPGKPGGNLLLEVETKPAHVLVQQEIIYTVRLLVGAGLGRASLSDPKVKETDAVVEKLGEDSRYETRRNGKRYTVIERRYAIFPQKSGKLIIDPVMFEGVIGGRSRPSFGMFDDDFFGRRQNGTIKRIRSRQLQIDVKPAPKDARVHPWLPARNVRLVDSWATGVPDMQVGEPATRTIMLMADGLAAAQLPEFNMPVPKSFKQYPDKPELKSTTDRSGVTGTRQVKSAIVPTQAGTFTMPGFKIPWWNTKLQQREFVEIPPRKITVAGGISASSEPADTSNTTVKPDQVELPKASHEKTTPETAIRSEATELKFSALYPWLAIFFSLAWMVTAVAWWRGRNTKPTQQMDETSAANPDKAIKQIKQAYQKKDADAARSSILNWAAIIWQDSPPINLVDVATRLDGDVVGWINDLDQTLYGRSGSCWHEAPVAEHLSKNKNQTIRGKQDNLAALNPPPNTA